MGCFKSIGRFENKNWLFRKQKDVTGWYPNIIPITSISLIIALNQFLKNNTKIMGFLSSISFCDLMGFIPTLCWKENDQCGHIKTLFNFEYRHGLIQNREEISAPFTSFCCKENHKIWWWVTCNQNSKETNSFKNGKQLQDMMYSCLFPSKSWWVNKVSSVSALFWHTKNTSCTLP